MKKGSRILLSVVVIIGGLLVMIASAVLYVGLTETGTRWVLERVRTTIDASPGSEVQWREAEGTLLSGLTVRDFSLTTNTESGTIAIAIPYLTFSWQPLGLLKYAVVIDPLQVEGLSYTANSAAQDEPPMTADAFRDLLFGLPVSIELQDVAIRNISVRQNDSNFVLSRLTGSAALDSERLQLTDLQVVQDVTVVSGELVMSNTLETEGDILWRTRIAERDYSGELNVAGDLQQLQLTHVLAQPVQINSSGTLTPGFLAGSELSLDLRHTFATLDLASFGQQNIVLQQGDIVTAGAPASLAITGSVQGQVQDLELLTLNLNLLYQPDLLAINSIRLDSNQIGMQASGALQLDPRSLQLDWQLTNLDPGTALPNVVLAMVTGEGSIATSSTPEGEQINLTFTRIEGLLNELPLNINGMVDVVNSQLSAIDMQVNSGANNFSVTGAATEQLDLEWQLQAPQLQQLWQGLDGELAGQGSITGTMTEPAVNGSLDGNEVRYRSGQSVIVVDSLQIQADASQANNDITMELGSVAVEKDGAATQILEQGSIQLSGTPAQHSVNAELTLVESHIAFVINGGQDLGNWQGALQTSSITGSYGNWRQERQLAISWLDGALVVEEGCWSYGLIQLCLQGGKPAGAGLNASLDLRNLPLAWLDYETPDTALALTPIPQALRELQDAGAYHLPPGLQAEGDIDVRAEVTNFSGGAWDNVDLVVIPENAVLQIDFAAEDAEESGVDETDAGIERFSFTADTLHVNNTSGTWSAELDLAVAKQSTNGDLPQGNLFGDLTMTPDETLSGELAFGFNDLGWIETVIPDLRGPHGIFNGRIVFGGTRSVPLLTGQLQLRDAGFALPDYGLEITEIELMLQNRANNAFVLEGRAKSGEGTVALTTTLNNISSVDRAVTAEITGTDFSVINTSYARANISPQLQLTFENRELTVSGGIILPLLDLDLEAMFATVGQGGVDVSRDVVVINAAETDAVANSGKSVAVPLNADVSLLLGEDVKLRGYGLNTRLNGELSLEQAPNRPFLVYGELGIPEGSFEIYNQVLNARDGRLIFFGNPANPVVDIRAFRETNDAEVGMLLSGNIKNMQGQLYSSPDLPEDEILALLITGKSFNNINNADGNALLGAIANFGFERGEGLTSKVSSKLGFDSFTVEGGSTLQDSALGLGKYITPDLLLRYKVGLFDRQSALSIDYNLTKHIKLEVETGISQSVDISYTIETD
ncbi:MAG: translocation/assembly module TamB domain-containing protein [Pseudomonadota bacterium]